MGQIPDMVIAWNSRAKVEIPPWLANYEPQHFRIECEEIDYKGRRTAKHCYDVDVFIDQSDVLWIQPKSKWTGRIRVTLESVNKNGDRDQTCFDVDVLQTDPVKY